jgi:hypothetical protein
MKNEQLIKLAAIIDNLNDNEYYVEAFHLNQEYIRLAQTLPISLDTETVERSVGDEVADRAIGALGGDKMTEKMIQKSPFKLKASPGSALKGFGIGWLVDMGANYAADWFESSQGPYKVFKANASDAEKILNLIDKLLPQSDIHQSIEKVRSLLKEGNEIMDKAKQQVKTACHISFRKVYNQKNDVIAQRGEVETEIPQFIREFITGSLAAGAAGGIVSGGAAALPAALIGGFGNVLTHGAELLWYKNISNSGKAYLQAKDLKMKTSKIYDAIKDIDINFANKFYDAVSDDSDSLSRKIEQLNLNNKEKTSLENLVQAAEEKIGQIGETVKQKAQEVISPNSSSNQTNDDKDDSNDTFIPGQRRKYQII